MLGAACLGSRDQERQIGGAVGCAEVDGRLQPGEADRGRVDVRRAAVRDRDAAGQTGGRLLLAGHRRGDQSVGVGGAAGVGEPADEAADHGLLVGAGVDVEQDQVGVDDGSGSGACHGDTFGWLLRTGGVGRADGSGEIGVTRTAFEVDLGGSGQRGAGECGRGAAVGDGHLQPLRRLGAADVGADVAGEDWSRLRRRCCAG